MMIDELWCKLRIPAISTTFLEQSIFSAIGLYVKVCLTKITFLHVAATGRVHQPSHSLLSLLATQLHR